MIYQTEMMREILKSERAQRIIDFVSRIYGESYVGLWLFEVIGEALDMVCGAAVTLRDETTPVTSTILLDQYEDHYGLPRNPDLTTEQRQARIVAKMQSRAPCNPKRLESAVSQVLGGVEVEITERVAKYTFLVAIKDSVTTIEPARELLDKMKPAHLIYIIQVTVEHEASTDVKVATAVTHGEDFFVDVASGPRSKTEATATMKVATVVAYADSYKVTVDTDETGGTT